MAISSLVASTVPCFVTVAEATIPLRTALSRRERVGLRGARDFPRFRDPQGAFAPAAVLRKARGYARTRTVATTWGGVQPRLRPLHTTAGGMMNYFRAFGEP